MRIGIVVVFGLLALMASACDSSNPKAADPKATDTKATPSLLQPRGLDEMKRVRQDVEAAHEAGMKRTDDAVDRAAQGDAVDRGAPTR